MYIFSTVSIATNAVSEYLFMGIEQRLFGVKMENISRESAFSLLCEYTKSESLIKHALSVEASMLWYARKFGEDENLWGMTGLLHDFDYEKFPEPTPDGHPYQGVSILKGKGYPPEMCNAIMGHAHYTGVKRESLLAKALFACDELSGLTYASVLVRPDRSVMSMELKSLKKKFKDKAFSRGVSREDIVLGAEVLGVPLDDHMDNVIKALRERAHILGVE